MYVEIASETGIATCAQARDFIDRVGSEIQALLVEYRDLITRRPMLAGEIAAEVRDQRIKLDGAVTLFREQGLI